MKKPIAHLEYHFAIRQDREKRKYDEHIISLRYVGEMITYRYKFQSFEAAMTYLGFVQDKSSHS